MSYETEKKNFGRERIDVIEIDLEYCSLTSGVGLCESTFTGDDKCFNTLNSCFYTKEEVSPTQYDPEIKTYRLCTQRSPHPIGLDAIPNLLRKPNISASRIDISGGLGVRSRVNLSFNDLPHADEQFGIDKYLVDRTYDPSTRGTFWTKLRSRNPNYQFRDLRVMSGYLVDGVYDSDNFETRHYVVESLNATRGRCDISGSDPLSLVMNKKALCPRPNTGLLLIALDAGITTATLTPAGIGDDEYETSGTVTIDSEMMTFTRVADVLTIVSRGVLNTADVDHSINATVQEAYIRNDQVNIIVREMLVDFAGVDASFIDDVAWQTEVDTFLNGLLSGVVAKPTDVFKLIKELSQDMPHFLWWDERVPLIQLTALKAPPISANVIDMDEELIGDSVTVKDLPDMRVSTVFTHFGKIDPTKPITEENNYEQTNIRIDLSSISQYRNNQTKVIFSRWISNTNKAAAVQLSTAIGRRLSDTPRSIEFKMDAKDTNFWAGQNASINHRDMVDATGLPEDTLFQLISTKPDGDIYHYMGLEYKYGPLLEGDADPTVDLVYITSGTDKVMRDIYDLLFPAPDGSTVVKFIIEVGVEVGGTGLLAGLDTGSWPVGAVVTLQIDIGGFSVGKGGLGSGDGSGAAIVGGLAIILNHDLELINNGVIGGGGGGGGRSVDIDGSVTANAAGGGGAGNIAGSAGFNTNVSSGTPQTDINAQSGTLENGGDGGQIFFFFGSGAVSATGGDGGDLGDAGANGNTTNGAAAGLAIDKNGFVLTETVVGDIRGYPASVIP